MCEIPFSEAHICYRCIVTKVRELAADWEKCDCESCRVHAADLRNALKVNMEVCSCLPGRYVCAHHRGKRLK